MTRVLLVPDLPVEQWPSMDRYASRLVAHLEPSPDLRFAVAGPIARLTDDARDGRAADRARRTATRPVAEARRYLQRYYLYPRRVRRQPADIVHVLDHSYAHIIRTRPQIPSVVTVHDLLPLMVVGRAASTLRERIRGRFLRRVLDAMREARAWIVSTRWLAGELATWLGRDAGIHVIPYGVDEAFFDAPGDAGPAIRNALGIPADRFVVLHVGSVTERKNLPGVLATVHGVRDRGVPVWLLQVGGRITEAHRAEIAARGLEAMVTHVPAASEPDLRAAYRAADVLVFPSHYEGFGLPVLEAMASGLPVVTSSAAALTEVAGDAALVIDGRDPDRYVEAVARLAGDPDDRADLQARGEARARRFRWDETARRTIEVYRTLA